MRFSKIVLCIIAISIFLSSCTKENQFARQIEGNWDVELYAEDGLDLIGSDIFSVEIEFKDYDNRLGKGGFTWITQYVTERRVVTGDYFLNDDGTQLNFDNTDSEDFFFEFDIELNDDNLELKTDLNFREYLIQAKRI